MEILIGQIASGYGNPATLFQASTPQRRCVAACKSARWLCVPELLRVCLFHKTVKKITALDLVTQPPFFKRPRHNFVVPLPGKAPVGFASPDYSPSDELDSPTLRSAESVRPCGSRRLHRFSGERVCLFQNPVKVRSGIILPHVLL
jgi:hypothetical protein